jgi:hypothetical protein
LRSSSCNDTQMLREVISSCGQFEQSNMKTLRILLHFRRTQRPVRSYGVREGYEKYAGPKREVVRALLLESYFTTAWTLVRSDG